MTSTEGTSTAGASGVGAGLRTGFGAVLFIAWGVATVLWVYSAVLALVGGEAGSRGREPRNALDERVSGAYAAGE